MVISRLPIFKTLLVGEGGVGKTSLVLRYTEDQFDENMKITIGANFASKKMVMDGHNITVMLWDLGGQPRFHEVVGDYFRGAKFAIVVYDVTRTYTLDRTEDWIRRVREVAPDCDLLLVGNKTDEYVPNNGCVAVEDGIAFASRFGADCLEVSAKSGVGVAEMFETAARKLVEKHLNV